MPEPVVAGGAAAAGLLSGYAVVAAARGVDLERAHGWLRRHLHPPQLAKARGRLAAEIVRAGWRDSPERVVALTVISSGGLAALGLSTVVVVPPGTAAALAIAGAATGTAAVAYALRSAVSNRRRRLTRELAPLLELFVLELGGGGSPISALGSVTMQLDGELAGELRRLLIASHVSGSATFEARLRECSDRLRLPALGSLATILTASREFGTGVTQGVRALAADLRRAQRRELIAHSRRALNHVLFPAAIGVLLPFLAILLFPAVTALQRNLR
jgi:Flp pilus assembly protein TadB